MSQNSSLRKVLGNKKAISWATKAVPAQATAV
jgi:hypothetical protein